MAIPALLGDAFGPDRATYDDLLQFWRRFPGIDPDGVFVVETAGGEVVGTVTGRIDPSSPMRGWVHLIAVASSYRGHALGRLLVIQALHYLAARGASLALVGTRETNTVAISMYAAIGFVPSIEGHEDFETWRAIRVALESSPDRRRLSLHAIDAALSASSAHQ
jgi:ribosomal protein S18 acetylase RimI-like enzyme